MQLAGRASAGLALAGNLSLADWRILRYGSGQMDDLAIIPHSGPIVRLTNRQIKERAATMWELSEEEVRWAIERLREELAKDDVSTTDRRNWMRLHKDYLDLLATQATEMMKTEIVAEQMTMQGNRSFKPNEKVPEITVMPKEKKNGPDQLQSNTDPAAA